VHIGGDWYDSLFCFRTDPLTVVIGDVSGHDRHAAAAMAQLRNLLRGIAVTLRKPPSAVLIALDQAITTLAVDAFATAVLAQVEQSELQARHGLRTLRWSNAGHPPPALLAADGSVWLLHTTPETMLGTRSTPQRSDHAVTLEPGSSVVFYTDGLIERRTVGLDESLEQLRAALSRRHNLSAEQLCDHPLGHFAKTADDDIVLLVVHTYPQDGPRPAAAGPQRIPDDVHDDDITTHASPRPSGRAHRYDQPAQAGVGEFLPTTTTVPSMGTMICCRNDVRPSWRMATASNGSPAVSAAGERRCPFRRGRCRQRSGAGRCIGSCVTGCRLL
jgi:hypothetical protein